jgi:hypothetical protein
LQNELRSHLPDNLRPLGVSFDVPFFTVHLPVNSADKLVQFIEEIIANFLFFQNTEIQNELPMMLMVNDD